MGLTMKEKKAVSKEIAKRYKKARKREKGKILDEFTKLTNHSRLRWTPLSRQKII